MRTLTMLVLTLLMSAPAFAEVLCPRVTSEHNADVTDLLRFRQYASWKDKTGNDLAIAIWQYVCGTETGLYHMNEVLDGPDISNEYSTVRDPIKLMNVYNVGYCGIFGPTLDGIFQGVGFEKGRSFGIQKWSHRTTEVWYDNAWHYFDLDVRGALIKPDGIIASFEEARNQRDLWVNPVKKIEPFFPNDRDKSKIFDIYHSSPFEYEYRWFQAGHVMDFRLRQGESFTRWWRPQGGRWHHLDIYNKGFVRNLLLTEPRGYRSNHANFSIWTQGNGLWHYEPNLTSDSTDFEDGAQGVKNLESDGGGLKIKGPGIAEVVFEVFSPWIIVPKINNLDDEKDDVEASVVTLDAAAPVTVLASTDNGKTWAEAATVQPGKGTVDLTKQVRDTYGYLLKLQAAGKPGDVMLRSMAIDTWVQVAPISLPRLKEGENKCRYDIGDRYDKPTRAMFVLPNVSDPEDLKKYVVEMPKNYDPKRLTSRIVGDIVLKLEAPEGTLIDWFTAGACFTTNQTAAAKNTDNRIAYAVGEPKDFKEVYKANCPTPWINHWRYQWDQDVRLDKPAKVVYVRYTGRPAVNVLRATLHLKTEAAPAKAVQITHGYNLGGKLVEKVIEMKEPGDYTVKVDGKPDNVFIRMAVPSK